MENREFAERYETGRLILRRYAHDDASGIVSLVEDNRHELLREFSQLASLRNEAEAHSFIDEKLEQWTAAKTFCYGIWRKQEIQQIGQIQVKNIAWEVPCAELGYFIGEKWQGQGFASESITTVLRLAFERMTFQSIFVRILPSNQKSFALAMKLGFLEEGVLRSAFRCGHGELHDVRCLSLTQADYQKGSKIGT